MALSDRQRAFVHEYLIDLNATAAYKRAGYRATGRAAENAASRLLGFVGVAAAIAAAQAQRAARLDVSADAVVRELARLAFSDLRKLVKWGPAGVELLDSTHLSDDAAACVESVTQTTSESGGSLKIKLHAKSSALKLLGEHLGVFRERDPLESLLALLPADVAGPLRELLARRLSEAGAGASSGAGQAHPAP